MGECNLDLVGQGVVELLGLDPDRGPDPGDVDIGTSVQGFDGLLASSLEVVDVACRGDPELRASPELQADIEALAEQTDGGEDEQDHRRGIPGLLAPHEVDGTLAGVEVITELGEAAHDFVPSAAARCAAIVTRPRPA